MSATKHLRSLGFIRVKIGVGYAYIKDFPAVDGRPKTIVTPNVHISSGVEDTNGTLKSMDEPCLVYVDDGNTIVRSAAADDVEAAVKIAEAWLAMGLEAACKAVPEKVAA